VVSARAVSARVRQGRHLMQQPKIPEYPKSHAATLPALIKGCLPCFVPANWRLTLCARL
jgi:hypothetical protein